MRGDSKVEEEQFIKEKEVKHSWVAPVIIILIILLLASGALAYLFYYKSTTTFIDSIKNNLISFSNEFIKEKKCNDCNTKDIKISGNLKLEVLDDINYNIELSPIKNMANILLSYGSDLNKIDGNVIFQDNNLYLNSNLLDNLINLGKSDTDLNIDFEDIDYEYIIKTLVEYYFEGLKEAKLDTRIAGIKEKIYVITLDEVSSKNANEKFEKLVSSNEKLQIINDNYDLDNLDIYPISKIEVKVNIWTDQIIDYTFTLPDVTLKGEYDGTKYTLGDEDYNIELYEEEETTRLYLTYLDEPVMTLKYEKDKKLELNIKESEDIYFDGVINKETDNKYNYTFKLEGMEESFKLTGDITEIDEYTAKLKINGIVTVEGESYNFSASCDILLGDNLVSKQNVKNAIEVEDLSEEEILNIVGTIVNVLGIPGIEA